LVSTLLANFVVRRALAVRRALPSRRAARRILKNLSPLRERRPSRSA
jgi:hypothetical protein